MVTAVFSGGGSALIVEIFPKIHHFWRHLNVVLQGKGVKGKPKTVMKT